MAPSDFRNYWLLTSWHLKAHDQIMKQKKQQLPISELQSRKSARVLKFKGKKFFAEGKQRILCILLCTHTHTYKYIHEDHQLKVINMKELVCFFVTDSRLPS